MTGTSTYLDISVEGIQRYLGRTPDLKGRRGASAWLSEATDRKRLADWLVTTPGLGDHNVQVNHEAGEADGKVPLKLPTTVDAREVARMVLADLRTRLPAARMRAVWSDGASYVEAYQGQSSAPDSSMLTYRPAPGDFPPLETCGRCRIDPAVTDPVRFQDEEPKRLCADCHARYVECYRLPGLREGAVPVGAERRLLEALELDHSHVVQTFDDLAGLGEPDGNRNHLATVAADGNGIGALFGQVAKLEDATAKAEVSAAVSAATRQALQAATRAVSDGPGTAPAMPVIPHVVGGDDLLVSVVADRAWLFVTTYLDEFGRRLGAVPALAPHLRDGGPPPSTSAGIVFAHATFPFRQAVELSEKLLRKAKDDHLGDTAAVSWVDVTKEGHQVPPHRAAWTAQELSDQAEALRVLRTVAPAGLAVMERLIDLEDPALTAALLRDHARRLGRADVLEPFMHGSRGLAGVADALSLVRWWR